MILILGASGGIGAALLEHASREERPKFEYVQGATRSDYDLALTAGFDSFFQNINRTNAHATDPLYVIYCPGVVHSKYAVQTGDHDIDEQLRVNLGGAMRCGRSFAHMVKTRPGSSILFLGSVVGRLGVVGASVYGATKAALCGYVRGLAKELARYDSRANVIEMGYFDAGMWHTIPPVQQDEILESIPARRLGKTEELWNLCSAVLRNGYVSGAAITISGGL